RQLDRPHAPSIPPTHTSGKFDPGRSLRNDAAVRAPAWTLAHVFRRVADSAVAPKVFRTTRGGHMSAVHVLEGGRHPAVLDVPAGALEVSARPAGAVKVSLVIPTFDDSRNLTELARLLSASPARCR